MRTSSIGLLCAAQMRAPHCSYSQLNDGVDGIGTSVSRVGNTRGRPINALPLSFIPAVGVSVVRRVVSNN
jgi:hypothetical protein